MVHRVIQIRCCHILKLQDTGTFDSLEDLLHEKAELRLISMANGGQFVTTGGVRRMRKSSVDNLDMVLHYLLLATQDLAKEP